MLALCHVFNCIFKQMNVKIFIVINYLDIIGITTKMIRESQLSVLPVLPSSENNARPKMVISSRHCISSHWSG